jgi:nucleotide-binding universal stress UspA family protein
MLHYTKILCAVDFDEYAATVFLVAAALAKETDAMLHVLHVARVPAPDMDVPLPFAANPRWEREGRLRLEQLIRQNLTGQMRYEIHVVTGVPDSDIVRVAAQLEVDLIAMATHSRSRVSHLVLGSVAEHVIREANCPVLVLRPTNPGVEPVKPSP